MAIVFPRVTAFAGIAAVAALLATACGGGQATPTSIPTPTPSPTSTRPAPTSAPTSPAPTATPTQAPAATPTPAPSGPPTPAVLPGKRGGVLQTTVRTGYIDTFDLYSAGGRGGVPVYDPFLNNLLWIDPYGDGKTLVGDVAQGWAFSDGGKTLTFTLRHGIQFHDGQPLTAKDVAYNVDRAWKPRSRTMTEFAGKFDSLQKIETPDDYTVRLTLAKPSNFVLLGLSNTQFLVYPAHIPLPEGNDQWKRSVIGSGPFKLKSVVVATKVEGARNDSYWKPGLPYLDGIVLNAINDDALVVSGYRTGRLDATSLDHGPLQTLIADGTLAKEQGFVAYRAIGGARVLQFVQRAPWTDPRVREAIDLALDRQGIAEGAHQGRATPYGGPLLPPELGGVWGITSESLKTRPGYRADKTQDVARAKQLLQAAGVDPASTKIRIMAVAATPNPDIAAVVDESMRRLGFKTDVAILETGARLQAIQSLNFDLNVEIASITADDPLDFQAAIFKTGGGSNPAKWSDPDLDRLFDEQDTILDTAKRKAVLMDLQDKILQDRHSLMMVWYYFLRGANGYVKNYPPNLRFTFDPYYRWEQVWLDRASKA